jgi:hypothetical protein
MLAQSYKEVFFKNRIIKDEWSFTVAVLATKLGCASSDCSKLFRELP